VKGKGCDAVKGGAISATCTAVVGTSQKEAPSYRSGSDCWPGLYTLPVHPSCTPEPRRTRRRDLRPQDTRRKSGRCHSNPAEFLNSSELLGLLGH